MSSINWKTLECSQLVAELNGRGFDKVSSFLVNIDGSTFSKATPQQIMNWGVSEKETTRLLSVLGSEYIEKNVEAKLVQYKQEHVLAWLQKGLLTLEQAQELGEELKSLDLQRISTAFESTKMSSDSKEESIEPPDSETYDSIENMSLKQISELEDLGMNEIAAGKAAVIILGGGQGTRLGFDGPKGLYDIGLPSSRSLFQIYSERIVKLQELVSLNFPEKGTVMIPLFIMTSPLNHDITQNYFLQNSCFGLDPQHVHFFQQGTLPALSSEGKIIMQSGSKVSLSPDGNGGIFNGLDISGALSLLENTYHSNSVHVFSVDNVMCKVSDPIFIGHCLSRNADVGNKVVWKNNSHEKVGVVAKKGGKLAIVEYSELTSEMAELKNNNNSKFVYGAGNICNHYFTVSFLRKVVNAYRTDCKVMPYHIANKKVNYADIHTGQTTIPNEINAIKLEAFIFDCFSLSSSSSILEVNRYHEFGPVKNAPGSPSDSPDTARRMLMDLHIEWATKAGAKFEYEQDSNNNQNGKFEISSKLSYDGEGLENEFANKVFRFTSSNHFYVEENSTMFCIPCGFF